MDRWWAGFGLFATMAHQLFFRAIMFLRLLTCGVVCAVDGVRVGAVVGIAVDGFYVSLRGQLPIGTRLLHD